MVVTMAIMRMMQMPAHQVIHVITMRHRLMPTALAMHMPALMLLTNVRPATARVRLCYLDYMLIEMIAVRAMEVPVMQIISMITMANGRMAAALPM